jgi:23S rRNA pseudouridine1911/1915/1917 synthase
MEVTIDSQYHNERLDKYIELKLKDLGFKQTSRSMIKDSVSEGVLVNGKNPKPSYRLKQEDEVQIDKEYWEDFFETQDLSEDILAQEGALNILYEDASLIVLLKQKGVVVHPGVGNSKDTLANYLKGYLKSKDEFDHNMDRAGIVHRLDKGVSGIMVVAKNKQIQDELKKQFAKRQVQKIYLAQVEKYKTTELSSFPKKDLDKVLDRIINKESDYTDWFEANGYIGRDLVNRYRMAFKLYEFSGSKSAKSYIQPVGENKMLIKIVSGRMHQIRATLYYYGYHIKGDTLYQSGKRESSSEEIMLKSIYLSFIHPKTQERMTFIDK